MVTCSHPQYNLNHVIKFCCWCLNKNYDDITFISKYLYIKKAWSSEFADISKIATMFIKSTFEDSNKIKRIRNYVLKRNLYLYFLIWQKLLISTEKCWCQQNSRHDLCNFLIFLRHMTVPSFIIEGYVWQILRKRAFLHPPYPWAAPKRLILNRVNTREYF